MMLKGHIIGLRRIPLCTPKTNNSDITAVYIRLGKYLTGYAGVIDYRELNLGDYVEFDKKAGSISVKKKIKKGKFVKKLIPYLLITEVYEGGLYIDYTKSGTNRIKGLV